MTTKHTHAVVFGRKVAGCPRCQELINGARPVRWPHGTQTDRLAEVHAHFRSHKHMSGGCGPVCTFGDN